MNRTATALPLIPGAELVPAYHPPGARCLDCEHWARDGHPNLRRCRMFDEDRDRDYSCILYSAGLSADSAL